MCIRDRLATDPDCDRVGIAVNQNGTYMLMTGNEVGIILLNYIAPVSYTHLDVYKRQEKRCSAARSRRSGS